MWATSSQTRCFVQLRLILESNQLFSEVPFFNQTQQVSHCMLDIYSRIFSLSNSVKFPSPSRKTGLSRGKLLCTPRQGETSLTSDMILEKLKAQEILLIAINERLQRIENVTQELTDIKTHLFQGTICDSTDKEKQFATGSQSNSTSWTNEERLAKYRVLAQIQADEVIENARMISKEALSMLVRSAVKAGQIDEESGMQVMMASLIASGVDLEEIHIVADCHLNVSPQDDKEYAIFSEHVYALLSRTAHFKKVVDSPLVLPVLLGESIHPEAMAAAVSNGVHLIIRGQETDKAVF